MTSTSTTAISPHIANLLIPFCEAASINCRNADATLIKRIIISFSFINTEQLHNRLFPDHEIDWPNVKEYLQNVQYNTSEWLLLVTNLIDFIHEENPTAQVIELVSSTLAGMRISVQGRQLSPLDTLRICFAKGGISPTWDVLCKAFVLLNITDIDNVQVLEHLLSTQKSLLLPSNLNQQQPSSSQVSNMPSSLTNKNINQAATDCIQNIIKNMPSIFRHKPEEYFLIFANILKVGEGCRIRSHYIIQSLKTREELIEKKKNNNKLMFSQLKKPSLTKILEQQQQAATANQLNHNNSGSSSGTLTPIGINNQHRSNFDSFASFCDACRLPSNSSIRLKRIIYFMKCLPTSTEHHSILFSKFSGNDPMLLEVIKSTEIITPDLPTLKQFLDDTYYTGGTPFTALRHFHQTFIIMPSSNTSAASTPNTNLSPLALNWSILFRLYLAVYCRSELVKELWIHVWRNSKAQFRQPPNKSEFINTYVQENPIAWDEVINVFLDSLT